MRILHIFYRGTANSTWRARICSLGRINELFFPNKKGGTSSYLLCKPKALLASGVKRSILEQDPRACAAAAAALAVENNTSTWMLGCVRCERRGSTVIAHSWLGLPGHFGWMALFYICHTNNNSRGVKQLFEQRLLISCQYQTCLI